MTEPWICPRCGTVNAPISYWCLCQSNCTPDSKKYINAIKYEESAKMFFPSYGRDYLKTYVYSESDEVTIEELYQAFKERLLQEMKEGE